MAAKKKAKKKAQKKDSIASVRNDLSTAFETLLELYKMLEERIEALTKRVNLGP